MMEYGKIYDYRNKEEAKALIGKKVMCSDCFAFIQKGESEVYRTLVEVTDDDYMPFMMNVGPYQFIREILEEGPKCRPSNIEKHKNCPIIDKIPDKHGRIVDLDKVLDWLINEDGRFSMAMCAKIDNALMNAPVILEASNKTETPS